MDYKYWLEMARSFFDHIRTLSPMVQADFQAAVPLADSELARINQGLRIKTPDAIREFLLSASSGIHFQYFWEPPISHTSILPGDFGHKVSLFSNIRLCHATEFEYYQRCLPDDEPGHPVFPFGILCSGDLVAVDVSRQRAGPILYVSHDTDSKSILANTFESFLELFSQLCFLEPTFWYAFVDPTTNTITKPEKCDRLRKLFGVTSATIKS